MKKNEKNSQKYYERKRVMFRNTKKFLITSFCFLIALCIVIFSTVTVFMRTKSGDAISDIGEIYMSEMNRQLQEKFTSVINLRLAQLEGLVERTPPETVGYSEEMLDDLAISARVREFTYLGLYRTDGSGETVYGEDVEPVDREEFEKMLARNELNVTSGVSESGERLVLLMQPAGYEMQNGDVSAAIIAGFPVEYLSDALFLNEDDAMVYFYIIRKDGSYVIRDDVDDQGNYLDHIATVWSGLNGESPEAYIKELKDAMANGEDYSTLVLAEGTHRHIYCSPLNGTDWYLVSIMPYGVLDDAVNRLGNQRTTVMLAAGGVMQIAILIIFALYYAMTRRQLIELERANDEAVSASKAKSEFLSNMSHDIRTPMNGIVGMTAIAMNNLDDTARVKDCLQKITVSSKHLLGLINDVLDMSKIESGKMSLNVDVLSLRDTMDRLVNIVQPQIKAKNQHFDIFIHKILCEDVYCDSVRLNQVLINLLSNAVKFTPEGGTVNVYLSQEESPSGDGYVRCHFRVKDTGIGMSEEFQKTIFDTFTREKNAQVNRTEGTGLGMAITKYIVDAMKGEIEVNSTSGKGSEFHVTLDLERAAVREEDMKLPPWHILLVDNNEDLCKSAADELGEIGISADCALDGRTAVDMVEKCHGVHNDYQFVLIDWKMPGMDGLETTRQLRKRLGEDVPILIISAYDWSDIEEEALEAGAQGFISKPLFKSNLFTGLSRFAEEGLYNSQQREEETADFTGNRILLAEDNELNWEIAKEILSGAGFEVDWAENGKVCVEKFEQSPLGHYDLILMDIRMPVMDGYDAAEAIRALERQDAKLPIIAMTADAFAEDIKRCLACGMNAHIAKPIDVKKLMNELQKYIQQG